MKFLLYLLLLLQLALSQNCPTYYDYSTPQPSCKDNCPQETDLIGNNCLTRNQYLNRGLVFWCEGWVNNDRTICCKKDEFIQNNQCFICHGTVYSGGLACCPSDSYLDYTGAITNCLALSTGPCSSMTFTSLTKACCSAQKMFNIFTHRCQQISESNCDQNLQICCSKDMKLEYNNGNYECVSKCSWRDSSSPLLCTNKQCNSFNISIFSQPDKGNEYQLLSVGSQCCFARDQSGKCLNQNECKNRFANRGWVKCCPNGNFYYPSKNSCQDNCQDGYVLFDFFCLSIGEGLDLTSDNGQPKEINMRSSCNGRNILNNFPVCCPDQFFVKDQTGCTLCLGRIFGVQGLQICCKNNQYLDSNTKACMSCDGIISDDGTICCPKNSYIQYDNNNIASCQQSCSLQSLYNVKYCCQSLSQQNCQIQHFPTSCNPAYFNGHACRICPRFCGNGENLCNSNFGFNCTSTCNIGQIMISDVGCLKCHQSCLQCNQPMDQRSCLSCSPGYLLISGICKKCNINCKTCQSSPTKCTSCNQPQVLSFSSCKPQCISNYYQTQSSTCQKCSTQCQQCRNNQQCTMCTSNSYLSTNGLCLACDQSCQSCYLTFNRCITCTRGYSKVGSGCQRNCQSIINANYKGYWGNEVCLKCHISCSGCVDHPQNCLNCLQNNTYLNGSLGINLCTSCQQPCVTCISVNRCTSCIDGSYLSSGDKCLPCSSSCKTCNGPSNGNCLSCFGGATFVDNRCSGCGADCQICQDTTCNKCKQNLFLNNGVCIRQCPLKTYSMNGSCVQCDISCNNCNSSHCLACNEGYQYKLRDKCYRVCPQNYTPSTDTCKPINDTIPPVPPIKPPLPPIIPNTIITEDSSIIDQTFVVHQDEIFMNLYFKSSSSAQTVSGKNLFINFINPNSGKTAEITNYRIVKRQNNKITIAFPLDSRITEGNLIYTKLNSGSGENQVLSSKVSSQIALNEFFASSAQNLKIMGYIISSVMLLFLVGTKVKGHFSSESSNNIILHIFNFVQVCYLFKFLAQYQEGTFFFLNGFGISHFNFFPNFFEASISDDYIETPYEKSLNPDGNLLRNAGFTFSFQIVVIGLLVTAFIVSYIYFKMKEAEEMPKIRMIMRLGILFFFIGFMNEIFFAFVQLTQPSQTQQEYQQFANTNIAFSYIIIFVIPAIMSLIIYHFYKTYNSDVLQHYYTIRQALTFSMIYAQCVIMNFGIGRPLVGLFLIGLEAVWLAVNYLLYRYGRGDELQEFGSYFIMSACITVAYIMLCVAHLVSTVAVVVVVGFIDLALIVFCAFKIIGIYYYNIFDKPVEKIN